MRTATDFDFCCFAGSMKQPQGRPQGGVGVKPPLELDISQKLYYLRKGD